jgi:hypothetical protein
MHQQFSCREIDASTIPLAVNSIDALIRNFHGSDSALIRLLLGKDHVTEMTY